MFSAETNFLLNASGFTVSHKIGNPQLSRNFFGSGSVFVRRQFSRPVFPAVVET